VIGGVDAFRHAPEWVWRNLKARWAPTRWFGTPRSRLRGQGTTDTYMIANGLGPRLDVAVRYNGPEYGIARLSW
jgi:hypothetical protein